MNINYFTILLAFGKYNHYTMDVIKRIGNANNKISKK